MSEPHASRKTLEEWLERINARFQWCESVEGFGTLQMYRVNGKPFIVHSMASPKRDFGWEIYVPAHDGNETAKTLEAAELYLGLTKPPEPRDPWGSDPQYPRDDWAYEVACGDTSLGYWDWVDHERENAENPGDEE